jgi:hypothetical protein
LHKLSQVALTKSSFLPALGNSRVGNRLKSAFGARFMLTPSVFDLVRTESLFDPLQPPGMTTIPTASLH